MSKKLKKYFLYARKSSEGDERQALSIQSQKNELIKIASQNNIKIIDVLTEAKSAKEPGREVFESMVKRLQKHEAEGVICWKLDRLSRNPLDTGKVQWLIKQYQTEIFTTEGLFTSQNESTILTYLHFGMAQKYIEDLGKNAKRGMKTKAEMGWYPAPAPLGYLNTPDLKKGFKTIKVDPKTFHLVKKAFQEILSGKQASDVWRTAVKDWKMRNSRGRLISRSSFYYMLNKPFYSGEYEWPKKSGNWYQGKHKPAITREEFDIVQKMMGKHGKPIYRNHNHELTGLLRCANCKSAITASKKTKHYSTKNRTVSYTYYHCTRKNKDVECKEPPITEKDLFDQIYRQLILLKPPEEFILWAKRWISFIHKQESHSQEDVLKSQHQNIEKVENKLNRLLDMRINDEVNEETYRSKKSVLEREKIQLKSSRDNTDENMNNWRVKVEKALDLAYGGYLRFKTGERPERHEILLSIGSNLRLDNKKMLIDLSIHFQELSEHDEWEEKYKDWVEPQKYTDIFEKMPDLRPANPIWLPD